MSVGFDVETFMKAIGEEGEASESYLALLDQAYENLVAAILWGDRAIIAKETADFVYTAVGYLVKNRIPFDEVWAAVHDSNMSRLDDEGKVSRGPDGKVLKGPKYKGPEERIEQLVRQA